MRFSDSNGQISERVDRCRRIRYSPVRCSLFRTTLYAMATATGFRLFQPWRSSGSELDSDPEVFLCADESKRSPVLANRVQVAIGRRPSARLALSSRRRTYHRRETAHSCSLQAMAGAQSPQWHLSPPHEHRLPYCLSRTGCVRRARCGTHRAVSRAFPNHAGDRRISRRRAGPIRSGALPQRKRGGRSDSVKLNVSRRIAIGC